MMFRRNRFFVFLGVLTALTGCHTSLSGEGVIDNIVDGGYELIDASDDRGIPEICDAAAHCEDLDPCTSSSCVSGRCRYSTKALVLDQLSSPSRDYALDVAIAGSRMYVAENDAGVEAIDISNPQKPSTVQQVTTNGLAVAVDADSRGVLVAQGETGVTSYAAGNLQQVAHSRLGFDEVVGVNVGPRYTLASGYIEGVSLLDLSNFQEPSRIRNLDTPGRAAKAASNSQNGLVADSLAGVISVVFNGADAPRFGGLLPSNGRVVDVAVSGNTALIAEYGAGFSVIDFSDPDTPERLAMVPTISHCTSVELLGQQTAIVAQENGDVTVYDLRDPFRPVPLVSWQTEGQPLNLDSHDGLLAVALGEQGTALLQTGCRPPPEEE